MSEPIDELMCEIERYLAAVDAYRAEECPPQWKREDEEVHA